MEKEEREEVEKRGRSRKWLVVIWVLAVALGAAAGAIYFFSTQKPRGHFFEVEVTHSSISLPPGWTAFVTVTVKKGDSVIAAGYPIFLKNGTGKVAMNQTWRGKFTVILEFWQASGNPPQWISMLKPLNVSTVLPSPGTFLNITKEGNKVFVQMGSGQEKSFRVTFSGNQEMEIKIVTAPRFTSFCLLNI